MCIHLMILMVENLELAKNMQNGMKLHRQRLTITSMDVIRARASPPPALPFSFSMFKKLAF